MKLKFTVLSLNIALLKKSDFPQGPVTDSDISRNVLIVSMDVSFGPALF